MIVKAKELCKYDFTVTQKSPKQYMFTFTGKLQNLSISIIENLYRANEMICRLHAEMRIITERGSNISDVP